MFLGARRWGALGNLAAWQPLFRPSTRALPATAIFATGSQWYGELRYPVWSVLEYLASGMTKAQILADFEDLEAEDLRVCQAYAAVIVKKVSQVMAGDGTRRPVTRQQLLVHLLETGKVPPGTVLNEQGQIEKPA